MFIPPDGNHFDSSACLAWQPVVAAGKLELDFAAQEVDGVFMPVIDEPGEGGARCWPGATTDGEGGLGGDGCVACRRRVVAPRGAWILLAGPAAALRTSLRECYAVAKRMCAFNSKDYLAPARATAGQLQGLTWKGDQAEAS